MKTKYALFSQSGAFSRFEQIDPATVPVIPMASDGLPRAVAVPTEPELPAGKAHAFGRAGWIEVDAEPAPVPTNLPAWRIRVVLKQRGLLNKVKQLINSLPAEQKAIAEEQLVDSTFERGHPLIEQLGAALKLTSKDLDDIFREADALV